jgi:glycosyltransferase involved in cell wall biosynthesis
MRYCYIKSSNAVREFEKIQNSDCQVVGGSEIFLAQFLKLTGDDPVLVVSLHSLPDKKEKMHQGNVIILSLPRSLKNRYLAKTTLGNFLCQIKNSLLIIFQIIKFKPDIVFCWSIFIPYWASFLASRIIRAQFVYSKHGRFANFYDTWLKRIIGRVDMAITHFADSVIVHGPYLEWETLKNGVDPAKVISFDCTYLSGSPWNSGQLEKKPEDISNEYEDPLQILFLGRIERWKGIFDLLAACEATLISNKKLRLVFAGQGVDLTDLENLVRKKGLSSQVRFWGGLEHKMLPELIRRCYCVVTPTRSNFPEGRCMAAMEALVMGKPVIAPDFGPFPYLVQDNVNGLLYEADNVDSLREKIEKLINDNDLYLKLVQGAKRTGLELLSNKEDYYQALRKATELP